MAGRIDPQTKQELKELLGELGPDTPILLISNLTVIVLAMVQGWSILPLLWVYWWQNVIIGFFNWRRIKQLKNFSTEGFKIDGSTGKPTEKTKMDTALFFLLHYGVFQLFYLVFIITLAERVEYGVFLSATVGIAIFFFNHFFSYRYNLKKDLASIPNIGTLMFFPYLRVIPMHLVIFIGLWAGRGSRIELFFFLLLKTGVDLLMHVVQHVDWSETKKKKNQRSVEKQEEQSGKKRITLKARLKLWFLLGWAAFLVLAVIVLLVVAKINRVSP
ncbi:MAG: DUF6498-containing protein [Desulfocapsa sp.]|nr:DUF6498-containing protein [Desulfocapsa sp.]